MSSTRGEVHTIERVEQLQALASPVRHRILAALETSGPSTVRELAERLGTVPESLYYHLDCLLAVDLVVQTGTRPTDRRPAKVYDLASRDWEVRLEGASDAYVEAYADVGSALLRWADRSHRAALLDPGVRQSGPLRERSLAQFHARLGERGLLELNRLLEQLESLLAEHEEPDGEAFGVTFLVAPIRSGTGSR